MSLTFAILLTFACFAFAQINPDTIWGQCISFSIHSGSAVNFLVNGPITMISAGNIGASPGLIITSNSPNVTHTLAPGVVEQPGQTGACGTEKPNIYTNLSTGQTCTQNVASELGGVTLSVPGVYCSTDGAFTLTGTLTLNGLNTPTSQYIFKMSSSLTTAASSSIITTNQLQNRNVYFIVGGSASIGASSTFLGQVIAASQITVGVGATFNGRALSVGNFTSLGNNNIFSANQTTIAPTALNTVSPSAGGTPSPTSAPTNSIATITALVSAALNNTGSFSSTGYTVNAATFSPIPTATTAGRITFAITCPGTCDQNAICTALLNRIYTVLSAELGPAPCSNKCLSCAFAKKKRSVDEDRNVAVTIAPGYKSNSSSGLFASLALMMFAAFITL